MSVLHIKQQESLRLSWLGLLGYDSGALPYWTVALGEARFVAVISTADTEVPCGGQGLTF